MRDRVRFLRHGKIEELSGFRPTDMLLDYLRLSEGSTGTKEGCSEGDCGACTVAIGRPKAAGMEYRPVNACIQLLGALDGAEVVTVEDLAADGELHPVQAAMVEHHGSQCGFCTPGFVMSLFALYHSERPVQRETVNDWIAGNLCRCTGYRPIVAAGLSACADTPADRFAADANATARTLMQINAKEDIVIGDRDNFFASPASMDSLAQMYERYPDATIVGGATDVGLWINKSFRPVTKIIYTGRAGMDKVEETDNGLVIGAAVTFASAERHLARIDPDLGELLRRVGAKQVRAVGTIGGNIANGSPIGDTPPALIALKATVELRKGAERRIMPLEEFFIDYGKQARQPGEFLTRMFVPKLPAGTVFRCYKVSKRLDQDISSVMGAFRFALEEGIIREARIVYGGMAGTPKRAKAAEGALIGTRIVDSREWNAAFAALKEDFAPIDDLRASARYRQETAQALLGKALIEGAGTDSRRTRIAGARERRAGGGN